MPMPTIPRASRRQHSTRCWAPCSNHYLTVVALIGASGRRTRHTMKTGRRVAILSPVAWRTPPREYGAWETVAGNIAEGLVARGWEVTLFASGDSVTSARLHAVVERGYEEDRSIDPKVAE